MWRIAVNVQLHLMRACRSDFHLAGRPASDQPPREVYRGGEHEPDLERQVAGGWEVGGHHSDVLGLVGEQPDRYAAADDHRDRTRPVSVLPVEEKVLDFRRILVA